ncbi:hypothetical protein X975_12305, partial [Stegodyphus mimosarum]
CPNSVQGHLDGRSLVNRSLVAFGSWERKLPYDHHNFTLVNPLWCYFTKYPRFQSNLKR